MAFSESLQLHVLDLAAREILLHIALAYDSLLERSLLGVFAAYIHEHKVRKLMKV